jgi:site-specific DNA recombinase
MPSTNGHGPKRAILYARVSTKGQAEEDRYSIPQQLHALREFCQREGYEIVEEVTDPGYSGASLERPGMDRVRSLVAAGGVAVVLAQDRDRFSREPVYHQLLKWELEEHGTKIKALNDRGDDSPEGQLTDGILDQLARYERAKVALRTHRGKVQKARQGKILAGGSSNFGFQYNDARDGYVVDEAEMRVVRRIFQMVGAEGATMHAARRECEREGVRSPKGSKHWSPKYIRDLIRDDVYRPHTFEEVEALITSEVAAKLDPKKHYGIWWFNRRRVESKQVAVSGPDGERLYRRQTKVFDKPRSEWVAVPVPDSGVPREWVDAAREAIKDNKAPSAAAQRFWELSGGVFYCGECGNRMVAHTTAAGSARTPGRDYHYYHCPKRRRHGNEACSHGRHHQAEEAEAAVWEAVSGVMKNPEQLRADLDAMIELERETVPGNPAEEARLWAQNLSEAEGKRTRYQEMAASDLITFDELRSRLVELDEARKTAERELEGLRSREEYVKGLERDRDALLDSLVAEAPERLDALTPEERQQFYKILRLKVVANQDGPLEASWAITQGAIIRDSGNAPRCMTF